jgi:hypothetical protein
MFEYWKDKENHHWYDNSFGFYIRFLNMPGTHSKMLIESHPDDPLTGNWTSKVTKIVEASDDIFYSVIPFEMLRTHETKPQVIVQVGDYPAVCKNLTCDFQYVAPVGEVTRFTYTAETK